MRTNDIQDSSANGTARERGEGDGSLPFQFHRTRIIPQGFGVASPTMKVMLSTEARTRLSVVLVGARNPQNIGAAARAMQDFGFSDLRVVNGFDAPFEAAQLEAKSAVGAAEVMRSAKLFSALPEAIADCTRVAGTTAIGGRELRQAVLPLQAAAPSLLAEMQSLERSGPPADPALQRESPSRVAILFGSEKTGLTNEQLSYCSLLLTIPLLAPAGRHLSMNLGQAVAVCLYELTREGFTGSRELPQLHTAQATTADRVRLTSLLRDVMNDSDYTRRFPANARLEVVRQLACSLGKSRDEAATWMGILKLVARSLRTSD